MLAGDVTLKHFTPDAVVDPLLREARSKVKFSVGSAHVSGNLAEATSDYRNAAARVVIKTKNNKEVSGERKYALGHPEDPLTMEQFRELYLKFTEGILSDKDILASAEMILNLEKLANLTELMRILSVGSAHK